jgi:hypothetical protein
MGSALQKAIEPWKSAQKMADGSMVYEMTDCELERNSEETLKARFEKLQQAQDQWDIDTEEDIEEARL